MIISLNEAWDILYRDYAIPNYSIYDAYVNKEDWEQVIPKMDTFIEIASELLTIEDNFGIPLLQDKIMFLQNKLKVLELPLFGYKYDIPTSVSTTIKAEQRTTKKEIEELDEQLASLGEAIKLDDEIFNRKFYIGENKYGK